PEYLKMDDVWPITANYELHHALFDTNDIGPDFNWQPQGGDYLYNFAFQGSLTTDPAPAVLGIGDPYWMPQPVTITGGWQFDPITGQPVTIPYDADIPDCPAYTSSEQLYFQSGATNVFGLPFETAVVSTGFETDGPSGSTYEH